MDEIDIIISEVAGKESSVLCREDTSIGDTMDVLRSKWVPGNPYSHPQNKSTL